MLVGYANAQKIEIKDPKSITEIFKTSGESIQQFQVNQEIELNSIEYLRFRDGSLIYQEELVPELSRIQNQGSIRDRLTEELRNELRQSERFLIIRGGTDGGGG